ncbi:outer envelope protein 61 [Phtheirospermum japonicum]|uniref:Outer envelope protein 61 n=1 Tax=Phtheirospermum japonicum TaxID=374723 RepID=A0A830CS04_9LAMI|nr:outer envelope protein 61 [Phtheirospermum japonicum]
MFNGMMDPELMRMAQEQMSRMSPAELARIQQQMMSNPDLIKMASESMQNLRPEDFKLAAEQLKHTRPEDMAEIGEKMSKASPEELAAMRSRMDAQVSYEINAAEMLKKQGNDLHNQGKYKDALEKYMRAKKNLKDVPTSKGRNILLACSLNMMSCYLKTKQYEECISEGTEVLAYDAKNLKALYRRGQAYKELGQLGDAVSDLSQAHEVSQGDETIADVLRDAEERLIKEGGGRSSRGVVIEEITDEATVSSDNHKNSISETSQRDASQSANFREARSTSTDHLEALKDDPEYLQKMFEMSSALKKNESSSSSAGLHTGTGPIPPNLPPDMLKMASDMMGKMSPEERQKMFEMASSLRGGQERAPSTATSYSDGLKSNESDVGESSSSRSMNSASPQSSVGNSSFDLHEQMRNKMKDPATRQVYSLILSLAVFFGSFLLSFPRSSNVT